MAKDQSPLKPFDIPLTGKLITTEDPLLLGEGDFRSLINLRYTDKTVKGILGMTPINVTPTTYTRIDNGFHFKKDQPTESHILCQTTSGVNSKIIKSNNMASVPSQDTFSDFLTLSNNDLTFFANVPDGAMMVMPGTGNYIWGGDHSRIAQFVNFSPDDSFSYDYTQQVSNTLTDSQNIATLHTVSATLDANVMLLLHGDNNITDSSPTTAHTVTNTNVTFDASDKVFGTHSMVFNGTNAKLTVPDDADFDFSGGTFTIDCRGKVTSLAAVNPIYYQNTTNDDDSFKFYIDTDGSVKLLIKTGGVTKVSVSTPAASIAVNTWYHIELVESGSNFYIFVDGYLLAQGSDADRAANYTGTVNIGFDGTAYFIGKMDEYRVSNSARHTSGFAPALAAYGTTSQAYVGIMSIRKLQGVEFTIVIANASAATVSGYYWNGTALAAVSSLVDGTAVGGKTLAQNGVISFTSTVADAELRLVEGTLAFYYLFVFDSVDATTTISYCTADAPVQELTDIWDGTKRDVLSFYKYTTAYSDLILNVYKQEYVADADLTYAQVGSLTSSQYLYVAFSEQVMGIEFTIPDSTKVNVVANTIVSIDYFNGQSYVSVGPVQDGTSSLAVSMNHSGVMTWLPPGSNSEFETTVASSDPYHYYRIHFSQTLTADVRIDFISGIPAPAFLRPHRFAVEWQERSWLFNDQSQFKNSGIASAYGTNSVFNGTDSVLFDFGNDEEIMAATTIFTRFGGTLYDNLIVFKRNACYLIDGYSADSYRKYTISSKVGCVAPLTTTTCDTSFEISPGLTKHIIIFQSARGIEMFDGNAITLISGDIQDFFEPGQSNCINASIAGTFVGFYDEKNYEYHWLCATGSNTTLNREMVYDSTRKKWFEIERGTGKKLKCGFNAEDSSGNKYVYGGTTDGCIERLDNGYNFDGNDIAHTLWPSDLPLAKTMTMENCLTHLYLVGKTKNISTSTIALTVYVDGSISGITIPAISQVGATKRYYREVRSMRINGTTFSPKFTISTDNENLGFEPLIMGGFYEPIRENTI